MDLEPTADKCADGRDADDGTPFALLDHLSSCGLARIEGTVDVDFHGIIKRILLDAAMRHG